MTCIKQSILFAFLYVLATPAIVAYAGGLVNTGGDPVIYAQLELQRKLIVQTLERIQSDYKSHPEETGKLVRSFCKNSGLYSPEEIETCASYIVETAGQIIACNYGEHKLDFSVIEPDTPELLELFRREYPGNPRQPVSAATLLTSCSEDHLIYINYSEFVRHMRSQDVFRTLAHEMGHKVLYRGKRIDDITEVGGFDVGHKLLDAAAVVLHLYSRAPDVVTSEQEKEMLKLDSFKHFFVCQVSHGAQVSEIFRFFNIIATDINGRQTSRNYVLNSRGFELTPWTKAFVPEGQYFLRMELRGDFSAEDSSCNSTDESDFSLSTFLLSPDGTKKAIELDTDFQQENILCKSNPAPITLYHDKRDLKVECRFEGTRRL